MNSDTRMLYKLIICRMLSRVSFPLTNAQICDYLLDRGYADYFDIQQSLNEMAAEDLITLQTRLNATYYELTDLGKESLDYFGHQIPDLICRDLDEYMRKNRYDLREASSVLTDYTRDPEGGYRTTLTLLEHERKILTISFHTDTEEEAGRVVSRFRKNHSEIYEELYRSLLLSESAADSEEPQEE